MACTLWEREKTCRAFEELWAGEPSYIRTCLSPTQESWWMPLLAPNIPMGPPGLTEGRPKRGGLGGAWKWEKTAVSLVGCRTEQGTRDGRTPRTTWNSPHQLGWGRYRNLGGAVFQLPCGSHVSPPGEQSWDLRAGQVHQPRFHWEPVQWSRSSWPVCDGAQTIFSCCPTPAVVVAATSYVWENLFMILEGKMCSDML